MDQSPPRASTDGPLAPEECSTTITCEDMPESVTAGASLALPLEIQNNGPCTLVGEGDNPVKITHRWLLLDRTWIMDTPRIGLEEPLAPGETRRLTLDVDVPEHVRGPIDLRITLAQELVCHFDDVDPKNGLRANLYVIPSEPPA